MNNHVPYTILAIFEAKPGKETALKEILSSLIEPTLNEEGCINYDLHECPDNPMKFMFYENWINKAAHTKHCATPHIETWRTKKEALLAKPGEVTVWGIIK